MLTRRSRRSAGQQPMWPRTSAAPLPSAAASAPLCVAVVRAADADGRPVRSARLLAFHPALDAAAVAAGAELSVFFDVARVGPAAARLQFASEDPPRWPVARWRPPRAADGPITALAWTPSTQPYRGHRVSVLAVGCASGRVYLMPFELGAVTGCVRARQENGAELDALAPGGRAVTALAFSPARPTWLLVASASGSLALHETLGSPAALATRLLAEVRPPSAAAPDDGVLVALDVAPDGAAFAAVEVAGAARRVLGWRFDPPASASCVLVARLAADFAPDHALWLSPRCLAVKSPSGLVRAYVLAPHDGRGAPARLVLMGTLLPPDPVDGVAYSEALLPFRMGFVPAAASLLVPALCGTQVLAYDVRRWADLTENDVLRCVDRIGKDSADIGESFLIRQGEPIAVEPAHSPTLAVGGCVSGRFIVACSASGAVSILQHETHDTSGARGPQK